MLIARNAVRIAVGAVAAAAVMLPAGSAVAQDDAPTRLVFTREDPDQPTRTATLTCDPVGGSHPTAAPACGYLALPDALALPEENPGVRCFRYHPVTYRAEGTLRGRPVTVEHTYGCLIPELAAPWDF